MNIVFIAQTNQNENADNVPSGLPRFITADSVDDGKSALISRLLHDTNNVATDQLETVRAHSLQRGLAELELSLLTDILACRRNASKASSSMSPIVIFRPNGANSSSVTDSPGHEQYTRNMVTAE